MHYSNKFCYWSVADGNHGLMMESCIKSARDVGVMEDFHVYSNKPIEGAITHDCEDFSKDHYMFKIHFLLDRAYSMFYEYFVFIDADSYFVSNPGDVTQYCHGDPIHVTFEGECTQTYGYRKDWWGCPLPEYCRLMKEKGVKSKKIWNMNAGLWIVHREAIPTVYRLCIEFWNYAKDNGYEFTEEAPLAYAAHMLTANPEKHLMSNNPNFWASDWLGEFKDQIPFKKKWNFTDYMTDDKILVDPDIVHAMRSKEVLIKLRSQK